VSIGVVVRGVRRVGEVLAASQTMSIDRQYNHEPLLFA
jgi:hypothetical protein